MEFEASSAVYAGRFHRAAGSPCQDRTAFARTDRAVCAALADGAGSRAHSEVGAACATAIAARLLSSRFDALWALSDEALRAELMEQCLAELSRETLPLRELACTLLFFAAHRDGRFLAGHIGDGVIVLSDAESRVLSTPENGDTLSETYFLTGADAAEHLRVYRGTLPPEGTALLMSDGMAESLYRRFDGSPAPACGRIAQWLHEGDPQVVDQALAAHMEKTFSRRSDDDLSLIAVAWEQGAED